MFIFEVQKNGGDWVEYSRGSLIDCEDEQATIFLGPQWRTDDKRAQCPHAQR